MYALAAGCAKRNTRGRRRRALRCVQCVCACGPPHAPAADVLAWELEECESIKRKDEKEAQRTIIFAVVLAACIVAAIATVVCCKDNLKAQRKWINSGHVYAWEK